MHARARCCYSAPAASSQPTAARLPTLIRSLIAPAPVSRGLAASLNTAGNAGGDRSTLSPAAERFVIQARSLCVCHAVLDSEEATAAQLSHSQMLIKAHRIKRGLKRAFLGSRCKGRSTTIECIRRSKPRPARRNIMAESPLFPCFFCEFRESRRLTIC